MAPFALDNTLDISVDFAGGPTGYISVESVSEEPTVYAYMPLRNGQHLRLAEAIINQGHAEVNVRLKSGSVPMVATALETRFITLAAKS